MSCVAMIDASTILQRSLHFVVRTKAPHNVPLNMLKFRIHNCLNKQEYPETNGTKLYCFASSSIKYKIASRG